jgi:Protein of unknown function (DUF2934)
MEMRMPDFEERVRERARRLWEEEGRREPLGERHLDMARELVAIEDNQKLATKPIPRGGATGPFGEPIEPIEAVENLGEFPTITDQGESSYHTGVGKLRPIRKTARGRASRAVLRTSCRPMQRRFPPSAAQGSK